MRLFCVHPRGAVFIVAAAIMSGCGSSPRGVERAATSEPQAADQASIESISSSDSLSSVAPIQPLGPVSALEIANAPQKIFLRDQESEALIVTFADLNLNEAIGVESIDEEDVKRFPNWLKALNGEKIRIRGYMFPTFEETGIERFVLVHSLMTTNFGRDLKVDEAMQVDLAAGTTTNFVPARPSMEVIGIFRIKPEIEGGNVYGLYYLEDAIVVASKPKEGTR